MLISHKNKFIFIKTRKTAGTSIEVDLSQLMGPEDVVTPVNPPEEGHKPRNHQGFYPHMPANEVRKRIGRQVFNSYYKFCVERDPVEKCISYYFFHTRSDNRVELGSWEHFVNSDKLPVDEKLYTDRFGRLLVDRIVPYHDLNVQLPILLQGLGVPFDGVRARAKSGFREQIEVSHQERDQIMKKFKKTAQILALEEQRRAQK